jgi:hypothetical protein
MSTLATNRMHLRRAPSIGQLMSIHHVDEQTAQRARKAWQTIGNRKQAREAVDAIIGTYGVEHLGVHKRAHEHVYYCNSGDTYAPTVLFTGLRMYVGDYGSLVERNLIREPESQF